VDYEFHSNTSVVCSVPANKALAGEVLIGASNDGGKTWGFPLTFRLVGTLTYNMIMLCRANKEFVPDMALPRPADPSEQRIALLTGQLINVQRAVFNIQRMESDLRHQLAAITGIPLPEPATLSIEGSSDSGENSEASQGAAAAAEERPRAVRSHQKQLGCINP